MAAASKTIQLEEPWADPTLWWPDRPHLYWVVTTLKQDGKVIDVKRTRFGFRQWKWDSHMFTLNGVKWPMWADTNYTDSPQKFMELCQTSHMNQMRYWRQGMWAGMTRRQVLDYFDETGMLVRSSGVFDGQAGQLRRRSARAGHLAAQGRTRPLSAEGQAGTVRQLEASDDGLAP